MPCGKGHETHLEGTCLFNRYTIDVRARRHFWAVVVNFVQTSEVFRDFGSLIREVVPLPAGSATCITMV